MCSILLNSEYSYGWIISWLSRIESSPCVSSGCMLSCSLEESRKDQISKTFGPRRPCTKSVTAVLWHRLGILKQSCSVVFVCCQAFILPDHSYLIETFVLSSKNIIWHIGLSLQGADVWSNHHFCVFKLHVLWFVLGLFVRGVRNMLLIESSVPEGKPHLIWEDFLRT